MASIPVSGIPGTMRSCRESMGPRTRRPASARRRRRCESRLGLEQHRGRAAVRAVSGFTPQKGLDLLLPCLPEGVAGGSQIAILGSGDSDLEQAFAAAAEAHRGQVAVEIAYDEALSHLIIGGSDVILVPSRFEPLAVLTQLLCLALWHLAAGPSGSGASPIPWSMRLRSAWPKTAPQASRSTMSTRKHLC